MERADCLKERSPMIGTTEILVIAAIVLVLFGGSAIPRFARSLGKARKEFEEGLKEGAIEAKAKNKAVPEDSSEAGNRNSFPQK
jgi:sec-independent protein translocase protein TatA